MLVGSVTYNLKVFNGNAYRFLQLLFNLFGFKSSGYLLLNTNVQNLTNMKYFQSPPCKLSELKWSQMLVIFVTEFLKIRKVEITVNTI